jgi:hypothetical protein
MWTTTDGYILHLPRSGLMKILTRLQDSGLNELINNDHPKHLEQALVHSIGQLAKNARRAGSVFHPKSRQQYPVFTAQSHGGRYQLLVRPLSLRQSAILFVHFEPEKTPHGFVIGEQVKVPLSPKPRFHPNVLKSAEALQREAQKIFFRANPRLKGEVHVYHRLPLEWRRLFPRMNPNRLSNLLALRTTAQSRKVMSMWKAFRERQQRLQRTPTPKEILQYMRAVDSVFLPPAVKIRRQ